MKKSRLFVFCFILFSLGACSHDSCSQPVEFRKSITNLTNEVQVIDLGGEEGMSTPYDGGYNDYEQTLEFEPHETKENYLFHSAVFEKKAGSSHMGAIKDAECSSSQMANADIRMSQENEETIKFCSEGRYSEYFIQYKNVECPVGTREVHY